MKLYTLTLNPAFDIHCYAEDFAPFHENLARITSNDAGGKGVNISRALNCSQTENTAVVVMGRENAESFCNAIKQDGIRVKKILVDGRIRENITVHTNNAPETRISFEGFSADDSLLDQAYSLLEEEGLQDSIVTVTGRNPIGITMRAIKRMIAKLQAKGAKVVIDSRSFGKQDLIDCHPWLIKPNEEEIATYAEEEVNSFEDAAKAAQLLREQGIENVMISLGAKGAMLCCEDGCFVARAPEVKVLSTIGAGDTSIGGFCAAAVAGKTYSEMLRYAVSYGSAACMTEGTKPPRLQDIETLLGKTTVERL